MKNTWLLSGLIVVLASSLLGQQVGLQIRTESGPVEGKKTADGKITEFLGIPFAAPPVGDLRWREPQPVTPWKGVRKAAEFGSHCVQGRIYGDMVFPDPGASEDCLTLNVWTPNASVRAKLPVMVWIYGGGFQAGATSEPRQDGEFLAHRGVVIVSMNYRLGILGFFAHPELTKESPHHASGNYGLMDQAAAIQWVKRNIAAFGGDAGNITIFGESAGSFSVSAQMASPMAKDAITRAMGESGALFGRSAPKSLAAAEQDGAKFGSEIGADSLAKLRAMPAQQLLDAVMKGDHSRFDADVDGYFLPASPAELYEKGKQAHVSLLAGWNHDEGSWQQFFEKEAPTKDNYIAGVKEKFGEHAEEILKLFPADSDAQMKDSAAALSTADFIAYGTWRWIEEQKKVATVYRYEFDENLPVDPQSPFAAAGPMAPHAGEIEYVFGALDSKKLAWTEADRKVSELMQAYWTNFAKTGDPNGPGLPKWAPYNDNFTVMHLAAQSKARPDEQRTEYLGLQKAVK
jgi:para-nitrobenzyl esterase